ncbi:MAG: hypothetical protein KAG97_11665, partial [Victivallales bacterium]|nr:hypothetical protein [Victivallales bacterium]
YQLSCAAALDDLSDKSIYQTLDPGKLIIPEEKALRHLCLAENLLANLHWNVNEELAFREFCLAVALRQY